MALGVGSWRLKGLGVLTWRRGVCSKRNPRENKLEILKVTAKRLLGEHSLCLKNTVCACRTQRVLAERSLVINVFHIVFKIIGNIQLGALKRDRHRRGKEKTKQDFLKC